MHTKTVINLIAGLPSDALQKQVLLDERNTWSNIEKILDLDRTQILRTMVNKDDFTQLLAIRLANC